MDAEELQKLDAHADALIRNWSFAALLANVAPPPFDMMAVGTTFAGMGSHLAHTYGVEIESATLKEMGLALATGVGGVLAAGYVATGLLKYVPGVNLWVALLLQPPLVGAVAFSVGHAFKQYYHAILLGDHTLAPTDISEIAVAALRNRLDQLGDHMLTPTDIGDALATLRNKLDLLGASMGSRIGGSEAAKLWPAKRIQKGMHQERKAIVVLKNDKVAPAELIQKGTYEERKAIVVVKNDKEKQLIKRELERRGSPLTLLCVRADEISAVPFHGGPLRSHLVYIGHPHVPGRYFPAAKFHVQVFEDKTRELIHILRSLGATYFRVEHLSGFMKEVDVKGGLGVPVKIVAKAEIEGEARGHRKESSRILWEECAEPYGEPMLPENLIWYHGESLWQELVSSRLNNKAKKNLDIQISYVEDFGINASVAASLSAVKTKLFRLELGGTYVDYQETIWNVRATFG